MYATDSPVSPPEYGQLSSTHDPVTGAYYLSLESLDDVLVTAIVAVGQLSETDPLEMEPVYYQNDPELLDDLAAAQRIDDVVAEGTISLTIAEYEVEIERDETLVIVPPE